MMIHPPMLYTGTWASRSRSPSRWERSSRVTRAGTPLGYDLYILELTDNAGPYSTDTSDPTCTDTSSGSCSWDMTYTYSDPPPDSTFYWY